MARTHKLILTFILLLIGLGYSQGRKVETDTLKARYAFKIRLSGTWYDRSSFFGYLNGSNQLGLSGIADNAVNSAKIVDASIANIDIVDPWVGITAGDGFWSSSTTLNLGQLITMRVNVDDTTITIVNDTLHVVGGSGLDSLDIFPITDNEIDSIYSADKVKGSAVEVNPNNVLSDSNGLKVNYDPAFFEVSGATVEPQIWYSKNGDVSRGNVGVSGAKWEFNEIIRSDTIYIAVPQCIALGYLDAWGETGGEVLSVFNKAGDIQSYILTTDSTRYNIEEITFADDDTFYVGCADSAYLDNIYLSAPKQLTFSDSSITGKEIGTAEVEYRHLDSATKDSIAEWKAQVQVYLSDTLELKAFTGPQNTVFLQSIAGSDDGGGLFFKKTSGFTPNRGTVFDAADGNLWVRMDYLQDTTIYKLAWFGSNTDTKLEYLCNNWAESGDKIYVSGDMSGGWTFTNTNGFPDSLTIEGIGSRENNVIVGGAYIENIRGLTLRNLTFHPLTAAGDVFQVAASDSLFEYHIKIENCAFYGEGPGTTNHAVHVQPGHYVYIDNVIVSGAAHGIALRAGECIVNNVISVNNANAITLKTAGADKYIHKRYNISNLNIKSGGGLFIQAEGTGHIVRDVVVNGIVADTCNFLIYLSTYNITVGHGAIDNVMISNAVAHTVTGTYAFVNQSATDVFFSNCLVDTVYQYGFYESDIGTDPSTYLANCKINAAGTAKFVGNNIQPFIEDWFMARDVSGYLNSGAASLIAQHDTIQQSQQTVEVWRFDQSSDEYASLNFINNAPYARRLLVDMFWFSDTATTGAVNWGANLGKVTVGSNVNASSAVSTTYVSTEVAGANLLNMTTIILNGGFSTYGDYTRIGLIRDGNGSSGIDDMGGDAFLLAVRVRH